ncbi:MAG: hypothetical protein ACT4OS_04375 [Acidimicrobiales bacterium]
MDPEEAKPADRTKEIDPADPNAQDPSDEDPNAQDPNAQDPNDEDPNDEAAGDRLPDDLDVSAYVGAYTFPDIARRRVAGFIYLAIAAACLGLWILGRGQPTALVNGGFLGAAIGLGLVGGYHMLAAWPLTVLETDALVSAARQVGFPVGHASGQLGWRGLRSRPVWRILVYSAENPPARRGLVLVDATDASVLEYFVEDNPEEWAEQE